MPPTIAVVDHLSAELKPVHIVLSTAAAIESLSAQDVLARRPGRNIAGAVPAPSMAVQQPRDSEASRRGPQGSRVPLEFSAVLLRTSLT